MGIWPWSRKSASTRAPLAITLFTKPRCHLCDEVVRMLGQLQAEYPHELSEVDISNDDDLEERHAARVPVVAIAGRECCWGRIPIALLRRELRAARDSPASTDGTHDV